jgi:hypothetical protein
MAVLGTSQLAAHTGGHLFTYNEEMKLNQYHIIHILRINYGNKINSEDSNVVMFFAYFTLL